MSSVPRWPILAIFVLSGAAGLIYEVVWARQLVLVFGNTTQAVSAILTGFFGGMAIGSVVGGRVADRVRSPLRLYGLLEVILVVVVLATPVTFRLLHEVYRGAYGALEESPQALALVRFGLSLLALAPATVLMGATLPALTRYLSRRGGHLSGAFGRLYAANTLGAVVGTAAAGFVLIELVGLTGTLLVGAACSAIAGVVALLLDRRRAAPRAGAVDAVHAAGPAVDAPAGTGTATASLDRPRPGLALTVAFVSGLTSLGYQTLWTRLLASGTGNFTYVFTAILTLFLIGLAVGAALFAVLRPHVRRPVEFLAFAQGAVALLALVGLVTVIARPVDIPVQSSRIDDLLGILLQRVALVVLPATIVMGIAFPAASALLAGGEGRIATSAGLLLAANTLGAIVGTFVVPFLVIPAVGAPGAVAAIALVNAATAVVLAGFGGVVERGGRLVAGGMGTAAALAVTVALVGGLVIDPSTARIRAGEGVVYATAEDEIASVQAGDVGGVRQLWVTGTSMTLLTVDARLMPVLPLMLRPDSERLLVIAFGMGSAYRSGLVAGLRTDAVELVPSVPGMFGWFYDDADRFRADPEGRIIVADGRNHVELTAETYDIVVVDPPPPIESSGVSVIADREFYRASKERLRPGGVMMQWVPYGQTVDEFRAHIRTYASVFPNVTVAFGPGGYGFYMFGSDEPLAFDDAAVREVLARPGVVEDISSAYDSPAKTADAWAALIPGLVWISGDEVRRFAGDGPLITDDRPLPEYFLLRHTFGPESPFVHPALLRALSGHG